jgi:hypothetical protein
VFSSEVVFSVKFWQAPKSIVEGRPQFMLLKRHLTLCDHLWIIVLILSCWSRYDISNTFSSSDRIYFSIQFDITCSLPFPSNSMASYCKSIRTAAAGVAVNNADVSFLWMLSDVLVSNSQSLSIVSGGWLYLSRSVASSAVGGALRRLHLA